MNLKYWEWETTPAKEKAKNLSAKEIARTLFEDPKKAERFALILDTVNARGIVQLRDLDFKIIPKATWHRWLETGVQYGMLNKENEAYSITGRFPTALENLADYYRKPDFASLIV
jgi:hypothetical protein